MNKRYLLIWFVLLPLCLPTHAQQILNVIGDSYVANHKCPKEETWHCLMAKDMGLQYYNYGRNGSCIAFDRTHDGRYNFGPAIWQRYTQMNPEADYVIIIAGHNDATKCGNSKDSLQMFADSLDYMIRGIRALCSKARIGFVTPWYNEAPGFSHVVKIIHKTCKRYHIPVLSNYSKHSVIKVRDKAFRAKYFQGPNDTAHLNAEGHILFLPTAEAWFRKNLMKEDND